MFRELKDPSSFIEIYIDEIKETLSLGESIKTLFEMLNQMERYHFNPHIIKNKRIRQGVEKSMVILIREIHKLEELRDSLEILRK